MSKYFYENGVIFDLNGNVFLDTHSLDQDDAARKIVMALNIEYDSSAPATPPPERIDTGKACISDYQDLYEAADMFFSGIVNDDILEQENGFNKLKILSENDHHESITWPLDNIYISPKAKSILTDFLNTKYAKMERLNIADMHELISSIESKKENDIVFFNRSDAEELYRLLYDGHGLSAYKKFRVMVAHREEEKS